MKDMLEKPVSRLYFAFLLPTVIATISNSLYCLADIYFISIGSGMMGLAAVNIAMPMYLIYSAIGLLFGVGASTIISIEQGAGNHKGADEAFTMSVIMMLLFGIILTILSYFFLEPLAVLLGASDELLPYVMEYLRPVVLATIAFIAMYACGILLRADHAPRLAMTGMLAGVAAVICDVVFTMGKEVLSKKKILPLLVLCASFIAVYFMDINIILVILVCGAIGALNVVYEGKKSKGEQL